MLDDSPPLMGIRPGKIYRGWESIHDGGEHTKVKCSLRRLEHLAERILNEGLMVVQPARK